MYIDKNYLMTRTQHKYIKDLVLDENNNDLIEEILTMAENDIDKYTKQKFNPILENKLIFDGDGSSLLITNVRINSIDRLVVDNQNVEKEMFRHENYQITLLVGSFSGKVEVYGSFGWTEVPTMIKVVERKLAEYYILSDADTQAQAAFLSAYKTLSIDGHSYTIKDDPDFKTKIKRVILSDLNSPEFKLKGRWGIEVV